jgi:hypothetical protein
MVYGASIAILLFYFIRPQDWIPGLAGFNVVRPVIMIGVIGLMSRKRARKALPPLRLMRSPHEWLLLVYLLYILATSPDGTGVITELLALWLFFFITMHAMNSGKDLLSFFRWWLFALSTVVVMGLGVLYGFDFTQSKGVTESMGDRLCLNHWLLNNPNAMGHTLVTVLPLAYFTLFRNQSISKKALAVIISALTCICLWHTQSKGAFLVGGLMILMMLIVGRPLWVKAGVLVIAMGGGQAALSTLPRMSEMSSLREDEGVVGRLMAWEMARSVTRNTSTGEGWKKFAAVISWEGDAVDKATHSAYVRVGADLGIPGMLLYLSGICCALRTLLTHKGYDSGTIAARRVLLCLVTAYCASGWMIDRAYHTEYFLLLGAAGCFHGLSLRQQKAMAHYRSLSTSSAPGMAVSPLRVTRRKQAPTSLLARLKTWSSYSVTDAILACLALQSVLFTWDYVMNHL